MPSLALTTHPTASWTSNAGAQGRIAAWGDSLVNYYRKGAFPDFGTRIVDTGAAAAFSGPVDITGASSSDILYARPAHGDDTYLYLAQEDQVDIIRVDTSGGTTDVANRTGSGGTWNMVHAGHPTLIVASHSQTSGSRITTYPRPGGGSGSDMVTTGSNSQYECIECHPTSGEVYASTFTTATARGVTGVDSDGFVFWDVSIPNAAADSVRPVNGLALFGDLLVCYTTDVDEPGGTRVNNNWWLIDTSLGADLDGTTAELLDVTVDGVDFATWADSGNSIPQVIGSLTSLNGVFYSMANSSEILFAAGVQVFRKWWLGVVGWGLDSAVEACFEATFASMEGGGDETTVIVWNTIATGCGITEAGPWSSLTPPAGTYQVTVTASGLSGQPIDPSLRVDGTVVASGEPISETVVIGTGETLDVVDFTGAGYDAATISICC